MSWLQAEINKDGTTWKVLGQQILMIKMHIPAELLMLLSRILAEIAQLGSTRQGLQ